MAWSMVEWLWENDRMGDVTLTCYMDLCANAAVKGSPHALTHAFKLFHSLLEVRPDSDGGCADGGVGCRRSDAGVSVDVAHDMECRGRCKVQP